MMKFTHGFGMLELLIALALSSFIMLGMTQGYRNAVKLQRNAHELLVVNRRIALLFNQIERDFTTGVAYRTKQAYEPAEKEKKGQTDEQKEKNPQGQRGEKKEPLVSSIRLEIFDDAAYRHRGKKWQTTKSVSLLCTTPLELFGQHQERIVRVGYELVPDKKQRAEGKESYQLIRRQTNELNNISFKERDADKKQQLSSHVVAQGIKRFSLSATYVPKPPEKKEEAAEQEEKKQEPVKTFVWTEKEDKKTSTALPEYVALHIELWGEDFEKTYSFECMIPCFVRDEIEKEKKEKKKETEGSVAKEQAAEQTDSSDKQKQTVQLGVTSG